MKLRLLPHRILMSVDAVGGVWRYAMDLAGALSVAGVEVVFAGFGPRPSPAQLEEASRYGVVVWTDAPLDWTASNVEELRQIPGLLADLVREHEIDLVHLNLPSQAAGLEVPVPVVVVSHSCVVTWFRAVRGTPVPENWRWQQTVNRAGFDRADLVLAPSRSHATMLRASYGPIPTLNVLYNAVRGDVPPRPRRDVVFAAARWWDDGKNGAALDEAAGRSSWPVEVAGPAAGPNGQTMLFQNARALGDLAHGEVRRTMAEAAIFVSPSLYEPFGLAALEAAKAGAALVLSDIATYHELWHGAAVFADPRSPKAIAGAINRLAAAPGLRRELGEAARERAARFSLAAQAATLLEHYAHLMAPSAAPRTGTA